MRHPDSEGGMVVVQYQLAYEGTEAAVSLRINHPAFPFLIVAQHVGQRLVSLAFLTLDEHDGLLPRQIQRMPLRSLLAAERRGVLAASGWQHEGPRADPMREVAGVVSQARRNGALPAKGQRPRGAAFDQLLRDTAAHYRDAQHLRLANESVIEYVARHIYKSEHRTRKLIGLARSKHYLGPALKGVAGELEQPAEGKQP